MLPKTVEVLSNTEEIQAVKQEEEGYLGVNIWSETGGTIAGITSNKAISLIEKTQQHQKRILSLIPHKQLRH